MFKTSIVSEVKQMIKLYVAARKPLFIHGGTGIGKSAIVNATVLDIARETNMPWSMLDTRASQTTDVDWRGVPGVDSFGRTRFNPPSDLLPFEDIHGPNGVLFLDELTSASREVQAALYQLTLDRQLGSYRLPDGWSVVAAGNVAKDKGITNKFAGPLSNRFGHLLFENNASEWLRWACIQSSVDPELVSFIQDNPNFVYGEVIEGGAFATPRSLTEAGKLMLMVKNAGSSLSLQHVLETQCGPDVALAFAEWHESKRDLPSYADIINGTAKIPSSSKSKDILALNILKDFTAGTTLPLCNWITKTVAPQDHEMALTILAKLQEAAKSMTSGVYRQIDSTTKIVQGMK